MDNDESAKVTKTKYETYAANYEGEWKKNFTEPDADQAQDMAPIGSKLTYRGAHYRQGQPLLVEGDPKVHDELNKLITKNDLRKGTEEYVADRHRTELIRNEKNDGAHFNYREVIKDLFHNIVGGYPATI